MRQQEDQVDLGIRENKWGDFPVVNILRLRWLEEELERVRAELHRSVGGDLTRLTDSQVLPISRRLDDLILEVQREKEKSK